MSGSRRSWQSLWNMLMFTIVVGVLIGGLIMQPRTTLGQSLGPLPGPEDAFKFQELDLPELDARAGLVQPTAEQLAIVTNLGASTRWNNFGTPRSLIKHGGFLATGLSGDPAASVREWIRGNRALFRLSDADVTNLELVHNVQLVDSEARALLFRQRFGAFSAAQDGLIAVGYTGGNISYVTSSTTAWDGTALGTPVLSALQAWLKAATDAGKTVALPDISLAGLDGDWSLLSVPGFAQNQRARLRALPTPNGVRLVYETIVLNVGGGEATAFTYMIDALNGDILIRHNRKQHLDDNQTPMALPTVAQFSGTFGQTTCASPHAFTVLPGKTSIVVVANALLPINDIVLKLNYGTTQVASSDTATSPEGIVYSPATGVPAGVYTVQVCPYDNTSIDPRDYIGTFTTDDTPLLNPLSYPPKWKYFRVNPPYNLSTTDTRTLGCWESSIAGLPVPGCQLTLKPSNGSPVWDVNARTGLPTYTTIGNNAQTAQSWYSPLTPSVPVRPLSLNREYNFAWTNQWQTSKCSPTVFVSPQANDTDAATANLFALHNLMHDWSYTLGFREETYNLQESNRGNVTGSNKENDPEIGNVQAGAIAGGFPTYLGRNNANQITLNDGIPGITNMYLWQSLAAAFYGPCVDGDYDMSVVAHEYGHAIQNRMVAGPDAGLTGAQSQSMGESWSDLTAIEFLNGYSLVPIADENPFAVGPYVTGSKERGIRNYGMNRSPLNFSNLGYDGNGSTSPHADGEIWSAVNYEIRQALIAKYNSAFPASNQALQRDCADGKKSADQCPGNRRWIQLMHDAFLLMQSDVSMDDARDAYLAADQMRFNGANQRELWRAFAQRGLGKDAFSVSGDDPDAMPSFESPLETPATITFRALAGNEGNRSVDAKVFVGQYEARAVPIADTDPSTPLVVSSSNITLSNAAKFVPGTYSFLIQAPGYGAARVTKTFTAGQTATLTVYLPTNYASSSKGATASGQGVGLNNLIDDTETTNAARLNAPVAGTTLTVDLSGGARQINRVQVSAALRPEDANDPAGDTAAQSRFTALRQFEIWTCNADDPAQQNCASSTNFTKVFTSAADAFPAGVPRPTAGDLTLRSFDIPATTATHVQLRVVSNQCTGGPAYQGDTDNDPTDNADCDSGTFGGEPTTAGQNVRIAELQVFSGNAR